MADTNQRIIKILLVDDDPGDRRLVKLALEKSPTSAFIVEPSGTLSEALALLENDRFDLALLDLGLPDSHGLGIIDKVLRVVQHLPIVVLTGLDDEDVGVEAIKKGASDYLVKNKLWNNMLVRTILYAIERKRAAEEREELHEQLLQVQKMDSIGMLAGGIAHDFNNLLQGIIGYVQLMKIRMDEKDNNYPELNQIEVTAEKAAALTQQLLSYARKGKYVVKSVEINKVIDHVLSLLNRTIDKTILIIAEVPSGISCIKADANQMHQVLLNLCINAKDAMPDGGSLTISAEEVNMDAGNIPAQSEAQPGSYVCLKIKDTGSGMDEETQAKIFEPFFTTKEVGKGTGLGLSMAYGVVENHGGFIELESALGKGTEFRLYLPAIEAETEEETEMERFQPPGTIEMDGANKDKRILVVDDDNTIRYLAVDMLTNMGYETLPAEDGLEAVDIFEKEKDAIDLVLLDMVMPKLGGVETFHKLRDIDPAIPIVLISGYTKDEAAQELLDEGASSFIQKPYRMEELVGIIQTI